MTIIPRLAFAALATASIPLILQHPARAAEAAPASPVIEAHDRFTVEVVGGKGPDVILIPGLATPREVFRPLAGALKGKARLHLVELRGFAAGDPGPNAQGGAIAGLVEGLRDYIAAHRLAHVRIVGHSLGGLAALRLAEQYPAGIDGVMIVDAMPFIGTLLAGPGATVESVTPQATAFRDMLLAQAEKGGRMPPALQLARSEAGKASIAQWSAAADMRTVAQATYEDLMTDARPGLPGLQVPLTILFPWDDAAVPVAQAGQVYRTAYAPAPEVSFVPVAQSGHFVMLDQPEAFERAVTDFLAPR